MNRREDGPLRRLAWAALLAAALPASGQAAAPEWRENPYAGLDRGAVLAGSGEADYAPEMRISSAIAYAQSVKTLSDSLVNFISLRGVSYGENKGQSANDAVKDLVESPLGAALTKTYAGRNSDIVELTIAVNRLEDELVKVYAQEQEDAAAATLHVRVVMARSTADYLLFVKSRGGSEGDIRARAAGKLGPAETDRMLRRFRDLKDAMGRDNPALERSLAAPYAVWKGGRLRLNFREIRVGRRSEYTLLVEDKDAGIGWIEHWPTGGADLMKGGQVAQSFVFAKASGRWRPGRPGPDAP